MELEQVEKIRFCRDTIKGLLAGIEPMNETEWEAFETLTAVHKALRKIDLGKISQPRLHIIPREPVEQIPLPEGVEDAMGVYGEDSLVERQNLIENENDRTIEKLTHESDKVKLIIESPEPGADLQQFTVCIGEAKATSFSLIAATKAVLIEFDDEIPACLSEEDQANIRNILNPEKPKATRGRPRKEKEAAEWADIEGGGNDDGDE
ncbi:MAG: hypothetical protein Q8O98_01170 [bacterium]|nr:hypothetical protein [bacterium]